MTGSARSQLPPEPADTAFAVPTLDDLMLLGEAADVCFVLALVVYSVTTSVRVLARTKRRRVGEAPPGRLRRSRSGREPEHGVGADRNFVAFDQLPFGSEPLSVHPRAVGGPKVPDRDSAVRIDDEEQVVRETAKSATLDRCLVAANDAEVAMKLERLSAASPPTTTRTALGVTGWEVMHSSVTSRWGPRVARAGRKRAAAFGRRSRSASSVRVWFLRSARSPLPKSAD